MPFPAHWDSLVEDTQLRRIPPGFAGVAVLRPSEPDEFPQFPPREQAKVMKCETPVTTTTMTKEKSAAMTTTMKITTTMKKTTTRIIFS